MKDIIIKKILRNNFLIGYCFFLSLSCNAKNYKGIAEIISGTSSEEKKEIKKKEYEDILIPKDKKGNLQVSWKILQEYDLRSKSIGQNLKKILNKNISIKGYMIPLDSSNKKISEFLLVPYMPSCYHVPPPPANMTINVKVQKNKTANYSYYPVEIIGVLSVSKSEEIKSNVNTGFSSGLYLMSASSVKEIRQ